MWNESIQSRITTRIGSRIFLLRLHAMRELGEGDASPPMCRQPAGGKQKSGREDTEREGGEKC